MSVLPYENEITQLPGGDEKSAVKRITKTLQNVYKKRLSEELEKERSKIGQELHDSVNPLLCVAKLYLDMLVAKTTKEAFIKKKVCTILQSAISNIKKVSIELTASGKIEKDFFVMVCDMFGLLEGTGQFKIDFRHGPADALAVIPSEKKLILYRVIQEQLANIIKHSKAKNITVDLVGKDNGAELSICDDGVGFDIAKGITGVGLMSMRKRVEDADGSFEIYNACNKGCCIRIRL